MSIPAAGRTVEPIDNRPPLITIDELSVDHANYVQKAAAFRAKLDDLPSTQCCTSRTQPLCWEGE